VPLNTVCSSLRSQRENRLAISLNFLDSLLSLQIPADNFPFVLYYNLFTVLALPIPFIPLILPVLQGRRILARRRNIL